MLLASFEYAATFVERAHGCIKVVHALLVVVRPDVLKWYVLDGGLRTAGTRVVIFLGRGVESRGVQRVRDGENVGLVRRVGLHGRRASYAKSRTIVIAGEGHGAASVGEECVADSGVSSDGGRSSGGEGGTAGRFDGFVRRGIALALRAVSVPVRTATVAAFPETFVICTCRIRAFRVDLRVLLLLLTR
eukprot:5830088-Pleurochrysis_carterae.AAC.1